MFTAEMLLLGLLLGAVIGYVVRKADDKWCSENSVTIDSSEETAYDPTHDA